MLITVLGKAIIGRTRPPMIAAVMFVVAMGLSRVYFALHWLSDVLVAWVLGAAWLTAVVTAHRLYLTVVRQRRTAVESGSGA